MQAVGLKYLVMDMHLDDGNREVMLKNIYVSDEDFAKKTGISKCGNTIALNERRHVFSTGF